MENHLIVIYSSALRSLRKIITAELVRNKKCNHTGAGYGEVPLSPSHHALLDRDCIVRVVLEGTEIYEL